jgi:hypothetical protein
MCCSATVDELVPSHSKPEVSLAASGKPRRLPDPEYEQLWRFWRNNCPELDRLVAECERDAGRMLHANEFRDWSLKRELSPLELAIKAGPVLEAEFFVRGRIGSLLVRSEAEDKKYKRSCNDVVCCVVRRSRKSPAGAEVVTTQAVFGTVEAIFKHVAYDHADAPEAVLIQARWFSNVAVDANTGLHVVQFDASDDYLQEHPIYLFAAVVPVMVMLLPCIKSEDDTRDWEDWAAEDGRRQ